MDLPPTEPLEDPGSARTASTERGRTTSTERGGSVPIHGRGCGPTADARWAGSEPRLVAAIRDEILARPRPAHHLRALHGACPDRAGPRLLRDERSPTRRGRATSSRRRSCIRSSGAAWVASSTAAWRRGGERGPRTACASGGPVGAPARRRPGRVGCRRLGPRRRAALGARRPARTRYRRRRTRRSRHRQRAPRRAARAPARPSGRRAPRGLGDVARRLVRGGARRAVERAGWRPSSPPTASSCARASEPRSAWSRRASLAAMAASLAPGGVLLVIDYGHDAAELYGPRRMAGSLLTYRGHQVADDPFEAVGRTDITAHVDLTALDRAAARAGLAPLGRTTQARSWSTSASATCSRTWVATPTRRCRRTSRPARRGPPARPASPGRLRGARLGPRADTGDSEATGVAVTDPASGTDQGPPRPADIEPLPGFRAP